MGLLVYLVMGLYVDVMIDRFVIWHSVIWG